LKEAEAGVRVKELCRKHGFSDPPAQRRSCKPHKPTCPTLGNAEHLAHLHDCLSLGLWG